MPIERENRALILFLTLTVLISSIFYAPIISAGHVGAGAGHYVSGLMWAPAIAAFITAYFTRPYGKSLGLNWGGGKFALLAYATPFAYAAIAYGLVWSLGFGFFPDPAALSAIATKLGWTVTTPATFLPLYFLLIATTQMIPSLAHALGEEIGWRGFLTPNLVARWGFTGGAVVTGILWTLWHLPLLLFADYHSGTPWWFGLSCFAVMVVSLSVMLTWLRLASNSVWPCAIFHASHNLFIQGFFTPLTGARGNATLYAIDEFGAALPAIALLFAVGFWRFRNKAGLGL